MGFGFSTNWLVWFEVVVVWWWRGGDYGGWCLVAMGHYGRSVWSSFVLVGLLLLCSLPIVLV